MLVLVGCGFSMKNFLGTKFTRGMRCENEVDPSLVILPKAKQNPIVSEHRPVTIDEVSGPTLNLGRGLYSSVAVCLNGA